MENDLIKKAEEKMKLIINNFKGELSTIRAGKASAGVLERIKVEYYGTKLPVNQVANVSVPEPKVLLIQPWDVSITSEIEKAIRNSDLGINPVNDGKNIRLVFPDLTEDRRKALVKTVKKIGEEKKVAIRNIRRDYIDEIKKLEKSAQITEDEMYEFEERIQKITDKYIEEINNLINLKEKDIMEI
ncbi:MAG: ribosome recycling factor [Thermoanaerobacteraceae bacterium]|nr:ribosome recycling factor [Thermoanaerobacteraceae bacterium]